MIKKELAKEILKELAIANFEYNLNNLHLEEEKSQILAKRLYNHCLIAGTIAEKIAKQINLDSEKCYVLGLLHDLGRFEHKRFHGIVGYEIAMNNNFPELAKVCITHCYDDICKIPENEFPKNEFKENDIKKVAELTNNFILDDYDKLIRLCDFMSIGDSLNAVTIEERALDIATRYNVPDDEYKVLLKSINGIKNYFEDKYKINIYELLEN